MAFPGASRVRFVPTVFATRDESTEAPLPKVPLCNAGTYSRAECSHAGASNAPVGLRESVWNDACKEAFKDEHWNRAFVNSASLPPYCPDADKRSVDTDCDESPAGRTPGTDQETIT